jgi:riboflavin synthase
MFTGIIEEIGRITRIDVHGENRRVQIAAPRVASELKTGGSVSVSGVCLTALDIAKDSFLSG